MNASRKRAWLWLFLLMSGSFGSLSAAFEWQAPPPEILALAGIRSLPLPDVSSTTGNPAHLISSPGLTFSAFHERHFGNLAIPAGGAIVTAERQNLAWTASMTALGDRHYQEMTTGMALSLPVTKSYQLGLRVNAYLVTLSGAATHWTPSLSLGALIHIAERCQMGLYLGNFLHRAPPALRPFPETFALGLVWRFDHADAYLSWEKEGAHDANLVLAQSLHPLPWLILQSGIRSNPLQAAGGLSIRFGSVALSWALLQHPQLPVSQSISLEYRF